MHLGHWVLSHGLQWGWAALSPQSWPVIAPMASFYSASSANCLQISLADSPVPDLVPEFTITSPMSVSYFTHSPLRGCLWGSDPAIHCWASKAFFEVWVETPRTNDSFISRVCKTCTSWMVLWSVFRLSCIHGALGLGSSSRGTLLRCPRGTQSSLLQVKSLHLWAYDEWILGSSWDALKLSFPSYSSFFEYS